VSDGIDCISLTQIAGRGLHCQWSPSLDECLDREFGTSLLEGASAVSQPHRLLGKSPPSQDDKQTQALRWQIIAGPVAA